MSDTEKIAQLEKELKHIQERNARVERDKARETSWTRKIAIAVLTYLVIVIFFYITKLGNPRVNAIVPTIGFLLSTLSVSLVKNVWIKKF
jgi:predicted membrane-bound mannosyltransferase